jgi:soluble lytic murein transglycosylase-like protein
VNRLLLLALLAGTPVRVAASPVERWASEIGEASARFGIPSQWIRAVMRVESGGETRLAGRPITSRAGAMGLMQLMPATWADMRRAHGLGSDPYDPRDNVLAGAAYLRLMYDRFGYPGLFAAYNAGPARYHNHLASGRALPAETVTYVARIAAPVAAPASPRGTEAPPPPRPSLFAVRAALQAPPLSLQSAPGALFAIRR